MENQPDIGIGTTMFDLGLNDNVKHVDTNSEGMRLCDQYVSFFVANLTIGKSKFCQSFEF